MKMVKRIISIIQAGEPYVTPDTSPPAPCRPPTRHEPNVGQMLSAAEYLCLSIPAELRISPPVAFQHGKGEYQGVP